MKMFSAKIQWQGKTSLQPRQSIFCSISASTIREESCKTDNIQALLKLKQVYLALVSVR